MSTSGEASAARQAATHLGLLAGQVLCEVLEDPEKEAFGRLVSDMATLFGGILRSSAIMVVFVRRCSFHLTRLDTIRLRLRPILATFCPIVCHRETLVSGEATE